METEPDYYRILNLPPGTAFDKVKEQYRHLAKVYHPDRNPGDKEWCEEQLKNINTAYRFLCDPSKKAQYDRLVNASSQQAEAASPHSDHASSPQQSTKKQATTAYKQAGTAYEERKTGQTQTPYSSRTTSSATYKKSHASGSEKQPHQHRSTLLDVFPLVSVITVIMIIVGFISGLLPLKSPNQTPITTTPQSTATESSSELTSDYKQSSALPAPIVLGGKQDTTSDPDLSRKKQEQEVDQIKQPLLARYNALYPGVEATIHKAEQLSNENMEPSSPYFLDKFQGTQQIETDWTELARLRDVVKSSIDGLDWWTDKSQLQQQVTDINSQFGELEQQYAKVSQEVQTYPSQPVIAPRSMSN